MWLKLLLIGAIIYGLYRLLGGRLPIQKGEGDNKEERDAIEAGDELVECSKCSTYVVKREAITFKGKYYCSVECLPKKT